MADAQYGVYVSIRLTSGELVSVNRASVEEVKSDLKDLGYGDDFFTRFTAGPETVVVAPGPAPVVPTVQDPGRSAPEGSPGVSDLPADGFEPCGKCGTLKTDWKAPGVSQAGKPYSGFWGCPNWKNH